MPASAGALAPETQPDDFRRATVTLSWNTGGRGAKTLSLVSLINNPSGGLGPRITVFTAPPDNASQLDDRDRRDVPDHDVDGRDGPLEHRRHAERQRRLDRRPDDLDHHLGARQPRGRRQPARQPHPASAVQRHDSARRNLHRDRAGVQRPRHRRRLARRRPAAQSLAARSRWPASRPVATAIRGRVDFTWNPNPERDIIGYRV